MKKLFFLRQYILLVILMVCGVQLYGQHGVAGAEGGNFATFDVPGAVNGTFPNSINPEGTITGYYFDAGFVNHVSCGPPTAAS
jgi:hypothetical protein